MQTKVAYVYINVAAAVLVASNLEGDEISTVTGKLGISSSALIKAKRIGNGGF